MMNENNFPRSPETVGQPKERLLNQTDAYRYDELTPEVVDRVVDASLASVEILADSMVVEPQLTLEGTIGILDKIVIAYAQGEAVTSMVNLHPDIAVRDAARAADERLDMHRDALNQRQDIYEVIKAYAQTPEATYLPDESARYLRDELRGFQRIGFDLNPADREQFVALQTHEKRLVREFSKNITENTLAASINREQAVDVPGGILDTFPVNDDGTLRILLGTAGPVDQLVIHTSDRELRQTIRAQNRQALGEANPAIMEEVAQTRHEMATLLGYESWAHYEIEVRMAKTPDVVRDHYSQLIGPMTDMAQQEVAVMTELFHADGYEGPMQRYDFGYYANKLRETEYKISVSEVSEYLPMDAVLGGFFDVASEVYGIDIRELDDVPAWHESVRTFAIHDSKTDEQLSQFYFDPFPRDGKYKHFAAQGLVPGHDLPGGTYQMPQSLIMTNFDPPVGDKPSLLTHVHAVTLWHEIGHILHQSLTTTQYAAHAGTRVERDFVEAPSMMQESWMWEPEILARITEHYQTGQPMPDEMIDRLVASRHVNDALGALNQIGLGLFDLNLHSGPMTSSAAELWHRSSELTPLPIDDEDDYFFARFKHPMSGYEAGYYSYQWSGGHAAEAFSRFQAEGITSPVVGADWRRIVLESGGSTDAMDKMRQFLDREPRSGEAYARSLGIDDTQTSNNE